MRLLILLAAAVAISGCVVKTEIRIVDQTPPRTSDKFSSEDLLLDVGVAVFDTGVPESFDEQLENNIQPEIRRAEANYIPVVLKNTLQSTGNWGAVRVVPRQTHAVDVSVSGQIAHSDGERLILRIRVRDSRGLVWFQKEYETLASKYAFEPSTPASVDPFQSTYTQIANDMLDARDSLTAETIREIRLTAEMRFARSFSPDAFDTHIIEERDPKSSATYFRLARLANPDDPMLPRVRAIREREYLFIDQLDEYFENFANGMYSPYQSWRSETYQDAIALREERSLARSRLIAGGAMILTGVAMQPSDNSWIETAGYSSVIGGASNVRKGIQNYARSKIHSEVLMELGTMAEEEISPLTINLENDTISLEGTVEEQYAKVRLILKRHFYEDFDLPIPPELEQALSEDEDLEELIRQQ